VTNLLVNAVKFTPSGGHIAVGVAPDPSGQAATVTVADDGMGLEPEMLGRLFEPFSQADRSLDRSRGGLGLGLSLVKAFVEMHLGAVDVHSAGPGQGSTFTLRLPLETAPAASSLPPAAPARPQRVLVVEDNEDAAESMAMMLELGGHEVAVAHTGVAGVEQARGFQPTLVLCDIGLPGGMDGYAVARAMRADPALRGTRLIALTGYGQEDDKLRAREAGFDEHLTKPVAPETLDRVLATGGEPAAGP
jgi:CheY-like chemotaxis protein